MQCYCKHIFADITNSAQLNADDDIFSLLSRSSLFKGEVDGDRERFRNLAKERRRAAISAQQGGQAAGLVTRERAR